MDINPFKVIARLLSDASEDHGPKEASLLHTRLYTAHDNNMSHKQLATMLPEETTKWLMKDLNNARNAWNRLHPRQPFPDLNNPKNAELIQELASEIGNYENEKVLRQINERGTGKEG